MIAEREVTRHTGGAVITMAKVWISAFHGTCFFILAILMKPCVNMNSNSSQKRIEEEKLLGTSSKSCELKIVLLSFENSLC